jgi:hypothetical protein
VPPTTGWRRLNKVHTHKPRLAAQATQSHIKATPKRVDSLSAAAGMWMKTAGLKILSLSPIPARLILGFVQRADNGGASHDSVFSGREDFQSSPAALAIDLFNVLKVGQSREHRD